MLTVINFLLIFKNIQILKLSKYKFSILIISCFAYNMNSWQRNHYAVTITPPIGLYLEQVLYYNKEG